MAKVIPTRMTAEIEGDFVGRAGLHHLLKDASGIVVIGEAGTSDEAVAIAAREPPDVILIDLDLRADAFHCVEQIVATARPAGSSLCQIGRTRPITMC